jgi:hypothetical protein
MIQREVMALIMKIHLVRCEDYNSEISVIHCCFKGLVFEAA